MPELREPEPARDLVVITSIDFIKSDDPAPPADTAPWVRRSLADNWRQTNPGLSGHGWYRARFIVRGPPAQAWAAYRPTVGTAYQMHLNGVDVGGGSGIIGPIARSLGVPRLDPIAPQLLRPGENLLLVRLRVAPNLRGGLGPVTLGPRAVVEPIYDADFFTRVTLPRTLNIALIFAGMLVLLLWLRRPAERIHGYFAALAIVWSAASPDPGGAPLRPPGAAAVVTPLPPADPVGGRTRPRRNPGLVNSLICSLRHLMAPPGIPLAPTPRGFLPPTA